MVFEPKAKDWKPWKGRAETVKKKTRSCIDSAHQDKGTSFHGGMSPSVNEVFD